MNFLLSQNIGSREIKLLNSLAALQISCGRPSSAIPLLRLARKLSPLDADTQYLLAKAYFRIEDLDRSEQLLNEFENVTQNGLSKRHQIIRSLILLRRGHFSEARDVFLASLRNKSI